MFTSDRDDAVVKIVDFGLSTFATEADNLSTPVGTLKVTQAGGAAAGARPAVVATNERKTLLAGGPVERLPARQYLSPELVLKKGYNREVDLWCIGILAYILTTSTFPFDGRTQQDLLQNIVNARSVEARVGRRRRGGCAGLTAPVVRRGRRLIWRHVV